MPNYDDLFTGQPTQQEEKPFDKTVWAARKQAEREGVYAMIDSYVQDMGREGGLFRAYLDVQARFDLYSVSNAILIAAQCPEATKLADFDSWKANGVYVRRGADAITILEPGKEYQRDDGSVGVSYNVRKVFDISQTRAAQRPAPTTVRDERLLLKALRTMPPAGLLSPTNCRRASMWPIIPRSIPSISARGWTPPPSSGGWLRNLPAPTWTGMRSPAKAPISRRTACLICCAGEMVCR